MAKKKRWKAPAIDGTPQLGVDYMTTSAKDTTTTPPSTIEKDQAAEEFKRQFGYAPEEVFYGQPGGTMIYCGPYYQNGQPQAADTETLPAGQLDLI